jgi:hypothetical protein
MTEQKNLDFNGFLMQQLSYRNYLGLSEAFDESPKKRTLIIQNPEVASLQHLISLSRLLAEDDGSRTPSEWFEFLITEYNFGKKNITLDEASLAKAGLQVRAEMEIRA